ncbi:MAG TPA: zinc ribbon domain-containing protein [Gammaproteobacteria bacterium]|nr:zinc ribbon domain protein [bacterium BMS3Abin11]GMT40760.1 MAG: FmdB family transcriptional regulator [bacterium]HDH16092.1 zinc ribbon domain-containing protein [Gammaproteobacteria bacterium]
MPIYEYKCEECGHQLEVIQKFSDDPLTECPKCKKQALKKMISASAFHLKGTGWYETDFKNSGKKPEKKVAKPEKKVASSASGAGSK